MSANKKNPSKCSLPSKKTSQAGTSTSDNLSIALNLFESSMGPTGAMSELNQGGSSISAPAMVVDAIASEKEIHSPEVASTQDDNGQRMFLRYSQCYQYV